MLNTFMLDCILTPYGIQMDYIAPVLAQ